MILFYLIKTIVVFAVVILLPLAGIFLLVTGAQFFRVQDGKKTGEVTGPEEMEEYDPDISWWWR